MGPTAHEMLRVVGHQETQIRTMSKYFTPTKIHEMKRQTILSVVKVAKKSKPSFTEGLENRVGKWFGVSSEYEAQRDRFTKQFTPVCMHKEGEHPSTHTQM